MTKDINSCIYFVINIFFPIEFDIQNKTKRIIYFFLSEKMSRTTFLNVDDTKAGMQDLDKEKINKLIQEASKSRREYIISIDFICIVRFQIF